MAVLLIGCNKNDGKLPEEYSITVNNDNNGTAEATVDGTAAAKAKAGTEITLTATPNDGYTFSKWTIEGGGNFHGRNSQPCNLHHALRRGKR